MADNLEPLLAKAEGYGGVSGCDFSILDEDLLAELRSMEAGGNVEQPEHVEDEDVYKMRELIREKPKDVIQVCCCTAAPLRAGPSELGNT
jgi:hypothetical protein